MKMRPCDARPFEMTEDEIRDEIARIKGSRTVTDYDRLDEILREQMRR